MRDVIVVGCGIVGSTIALALQQQKRDVLILDDKNELAGTPPSGGHAKPSWFSGMKKSEYEPALEMLSNTHGMSEESFVIKPSAGLACTTVFRVDTDKVRSRVAKITTIAHVDELTELETKHPCVTYNGEKERCRLLIIAAGIWCRDLLPQEFPNKSLVAKQGVSFRFPGKLKKPFIKPWAPYKQIVAHQQGENEIWVGDGTAMYPENWPETRNQVCQSRCRAALGLKAMPIRSIVGLRPYHAAKPCYVNKIGPSVWVATGAGKLGTVAGGYAAVEIVRATS
jgi:glycine/D-amino acid oxidase-like deaminating enzyme